ncbi:26838_t:CDS:2, partial [Gigaspora margarita]
PLIIRIYAYDKPTPNSNIVIMIPDSFIKQSKYEQLADAFVHAKDWVIIANINAVSGFSTLKWYDKSELNNPTDYSGGCGLEDLIAFIEEKSKELTSQKFNEITLNPERNIL